MPRPTALPTLCPRSARGDQITTDEVGSPATPSFAILTTNFGRALDPALVRRLSFQLEFGLPDEAMRAALWRAHLPASVPVSGDLDLNELAARHELSGGYIRNAALRAAFLAASTGEPLCAGELRNDRGEQLNRVARP